MMHVKYGAHNKVTFVLSSDIIIFRLLTDLAKTVLKTFNLPKVVQ